MRSVVLYILGEPGVGKTTLARSFLVEPLALLPSPKWTLGRAVCAAGHYTGQMFDGADTVPYSGARAALEYWRASLSHFTLTILDGARFSTAPSLALLRELAPNHAIAAVHLHGGAEVRRALRGSDQSAAWVKGAATKAANFARVVGALEIDALRSTADIARQTRELVAAVRS